MCVNIRSVIRALFRVTAVEGDSNVKLFIVGAAISQIRQNLIITSLHPGR